MPTYAILGATGKTGNALLDLLVLAPNNHINAYVRSKAKLLTQRPALANTPNVTIFEGSLSDIPLLASTLGPDVDAAFCVLGSNENIPGIRIAQDAANAVIAALCHIIREKKDTTAYKPPKLLFLSSASLNPTMSAKLPAAGKWIIDHGMSHVYADLRCAEETLRLHKSWLDVTFVQPSALTEDVQKGHKLSLTKMADGSAFVSYLDLAAGMVEIAQSGSSYAGMGVAVVATGKDVRFEPNAPAQVLRGLVWCFAPWLYAPCKYLGIVS